VQILKDEPNSFISDKNSKIQF